MKKNGQESEKHIYLAGWEVVLNGDDDCQKFMEAQVVDQQTAKKYWNSLDLVFVNDELAEVYEFEEGGIIERELEPGEKGLPYQDLRPHRVHVLNQSEEYYSHLGGEVPDDFRLPTFDFVSPFQYLGKLSKDEDYFSILPFDLHLVSPIYNNLSKVYLDYSDPLAPVLLNEDELRDAGTSFDDLRSDTEVIYEEVGLSSQPYTSVHYGKALTGAPIWIQAPDYPICPKTKMTMKFLVQFNYEGLRKEIKTARTNFSSAEKFNEGYFDHMNFWGDGDLFVFFNPESKVACYLIQHT